MAKKNIRELKVYAQSGYRYKEVSQIQLKGAWFREFGFTEGMPIAVKCEEGWFIITLDAERVVLAKAEEEFMGREMEALKRRFQKKEQLHAQFIAEHRDMYGQNESGDREEAAYV